MESSKYVQPIGKKCKHLQIPLQPYDFDVVPPTCKKYSNWKWSEVENIEEEQESNNCKVKVVDTSLILNQTK